MRPIDAALEYVSRDWLVLPCHQVVQGSCSCRAADCSSPGKHPRVARGLHEASVDRGAVERWWQRWPGANIGIRTGNVSGLVVVDIDPAHGGSRSIKALVERHGGLRDVPRTRTGSGGWHLYFAHPGGTVRNSVGRLGAGIDVRGDGGYVIAPPSGHAGGRPYRWEIEPTELPPLPLWLGDLLDRSTERSRSQETSAALTKFDPAAWARVALESELRTVRTAPQGSRNATLNRAAFSLGQIVGAGLLQAGWVEDLLVESGIGAGLGEREAVMTVRSGMRAGVERPRGPAAATGQAMSQSPEPVEIGLP